MKHREGDSSAVKKGGGFVWGGRSRGQRYCSASRIRVDAPAVSSNTAQRLINDKSRVLLLVLLSVTRKIATVIMKRVSEKMPATASFWRRSI